MPNFMVTATRERKVGRWSRVVHDEMDLLRRLLSRTGNTLNQLAARVNSTGAVPGPELSAALALLTKVLKRLDRALDEAGVP